MAPIAPTLIGGLTAPVVTGGTRHSHAILDHIEAIDASPIFPTRTWMDRARDLDTEEYGQRS